MGLDSTDVYLLLGSNLGDRDELLAQARGLLASKIGTVMATSGLYETAAWGNTQQPAFLNQAVRLKTKLSAQQVLTEALAIEVKLGRVRVEKWGSRFMDIDLIFYGNEIIDEPNLKIPHPYMAERRFVLAPMAEIAATAMHPVNGKSVAELLSDLTDTLAVKKLD